MKISFSNDTFEFVRGIPINPEATFSKSLGTSVAQRTNNKFSFNYNYKSSKICKRSRISVETINKQTVLKVSQK